MSGPVLSSMQLLTSFKSKGERKGEGVGLWWFLSVGMTILCELLQRHEPNTKANDIRQPQPIFWFTLNVLTHVCIYIKLSS